MDTNECIFQDVVESCAVDKCYAKNELTKNRKETVISSSIKRKDDFHQRIENFSSYKYHNLCYTYYTSKEKIDRHLKRINEQPVVGPSAKRLNRSSVSMFNFKRNCFICGQHCEVTPDPKNPGRWEKNRGILCRTADRGKGNKSFKEVLLEVCNKRCDSLGDEVRVRIEGTPSDLHAAEARYHNSCHKRFTNPKEIKSAQDNSQGPPNQSSMSYVLRSIRNEPERIWTSTELYQIFISQGATDASRTRFLYWLEEKLGREYCILKASGLAAICIHKDKAASIFKVTSVEDDPDEEMIIKVAKMIKNDISKKKHNVSTYSSLEQDTIDENSSDTLSFLLSQISPKLKDSLSALLINHMVTSVAANTFSMLQLALALLVNSKKVVETLHEFGITPTYHEVRRFKVSAAAAADKNGQSLNLNASDGLIQAVSDNFDATISSQNGIKQTHALASIFVQANASDDNDSKFKFPRLKQEEIKRVPLADIPMCIYNGPKHSDMDPHFATSGIPPLKILCAQTLMTERSKVEDFRFVKRSLLEGDCPDFHGFNTNEARVTGQAPKPKSKITFRQLIDQTPSEPSTMLTAMIDAEKVTNAAGQKITVFTADQQLYSVVLNIMWADRDRWSFFVPRLGGMHWLMSYIGSIGALMAGSGLKEILKSAFAGSDKILLGKKFPMNLRALRFVVIELLRGHVEEMGSYDEMECWFAQLCKTSVLAEHWIKNFIKPLFLMLLYVRAEREGEFGLHLYVCKQMMPYFFAAGHFNYARYGLCYINSMEKLPKETLEAFIKGEHVTRHKRGIWNSIWSDMMIETTYMKFGKGPGGIIGFTTQPRTLKVWAKSQHIQNELLSDLESLKNKDQGPYHAHKEETTARIASDKKDRKKIENFIKRCIHPLDVESHNENSLLCNVYTGEIANADVNVNKALEIGQSQLHTFKQSLPEGFRSTIKKLVVPIGSKIKRKSKAKAEESYDTELLFGRVMYLLSTGGIDFEDLFDFELSPLPTSLCNKMGEPRYTKAKSVLQKKLKVQTSIRLINFNVVLIDGLGMLHGAVHWPKGGTVGDLIDGVKNFILKYLYFADVYLIFDRYYNYSIKSDTRAARVKSFTRGHKLFRHSPLPSKDDILSCTKSKVQLIQQISTGLIDLGLKEKHRLVITSNDHYPTEIKDGNATLRSDLGTGHEEADNIIIQQVNQIAQQSCSINVLCEDTDVFVLLCHFCNDKEWNAKVYMNGFTKDSSTTISINETVKKHISTIPSILAAHALTGCDSVPQLYGIGKGKAINALKSVSLSVFGNPESTETVYMDNAKRFIARCYGVDNNNFTENRRVLWTKKTGSGKLSSSSRPKQLKSLPPTDPVLELNIKRARYQYLVWLSCLEENPTDLDPCRFGWEKDEETKTLSPVMVPPNFKAAPDEVLKSTKCNCGVSQCKTSSCSCSKGRISCSEFCGCRNDGCRNKWNMTYDDDDNDSDNYDSDDSDDE